MLCAARCVAPVSLRRSDLKRLTIALLIAVSSGACQYFEDVTKVDYGSALDRPPLDVPRDLSGIPDQRTGNPGDATAKPRDTAPIVVLPQYTDIKVVRDGASRYLVVNGQP